MYWYSFMPRTGHASYFSCAHACIILLYIRHSARHHCVGGTILPPRPVCDDGCFCEMFVVFGIAPLFFFAQQGSVVWANLTIYGIIHDSLCCLLFFLFLCRLMTAVIPPLSCEGGKVQYSSRCRYIFSFFSWFNWFHGTDGKEECMTTCCPCASRVSYCPIKK